MAGKRGRTAGDDDGLDKVVAEKVNRLKQWLVSRRPARQIGGHVHGY